MKKSTKLNKQKRDWSIIRAARNSKAGKNNVTRRGNEYIKEFNENMSDIIRNFFSPSKNGNRGIKR